MFVFVKRLCVETLNDCFLMKRKQPQETEDIKKNYSIHLQDEERKRMSTNIDADDNLENEDDMNGHFTTEWVMHPGPNEVDKRDSLTMNSQVNSKNAMQQEEGEKKHKKQPVMIGKYDEDSIVSKKQEQLDQEENYFEKEGIDKSAFNQAVVANKRVQTLNQNPNQGRFQKEVEIEDANHTGWVDDIEIEL